MKEIFVTVSEFLENGGELTEGRNIYNNQFGTKAVGSFINIINEELIGVQTNKSDRWPFYKTHSYVKINCQPIYI